MIRAVVFDVNETLLDLRPLDAVFERVLGDRALRPLWFGQMLQLAFVGAITGRYVDFTSAQRAALRMVAARGGLRVDEAQVDEVVGAMRRLPAHPDVLPALERLRGAGRLLLTLTNSPLEVVEEQLRFAGIRDRFAHVVSADEVKRLKPAPEPYRLAAERAGTGVGGIRLVAAHPWDIAGALAAGASAAFVKRPGAALDPNGERPDVEGNDLVEVAENILERDR
ncbi:MAG TPA: haloacid dehalogenase type II [Candidatus Limnocylindria bacterium]|nr:haloacid dehalogenase type II [Candidatus Limnocylindria bacterium]